ncbi:MAG: YceI family protein [Bacteroidia bacterium]|nr:YceI family protein [Bacteroidia bacterium]
MKALLFFPLMIAAAMPLAAQNRYFTRTGTVFFDAEGALDDVEEIKAQNSMATCIYDAGTGDMEWMVLIKSFQFKNALMQDHFNENYLESSKFPKATFKGKLTNPAAVKLTQDGSYAVTVSGALTMHGITQQISVPGTVKVSGGKPALSADFAVALKDYGIKVPAVVGNKVAETVKIRISAALEKFNS